jgi:hypothetical protein
MLPCSPPRSEKVTGGLDDFPNDVVADHHIHLRERADRRGSNMQEQALAHDVSLEYLQVDSPKHRVSGAEVGGPSTVGNELKVDDRAGRECAGITVNVVCELLLRATDCTVTRNLEQLLNPEHRAIARRV